MKRQRKKVHFFVSYARANKLLAGRFLTRFREIVEPSKTYLYKFWHDDQILVGEQWSDEIRLALAECDLGLLLVSPMFLGSKYVSEQELPRFVGAAAKPVVPVMLQPVDFERHDLKGLRATQIFRLEGERFQRSKSYYDCSAQQRDRFAMELFQEVEARLDRLYS